jgi:hypothetical protein
VLFAELADVIGDQQLLGRYSCIDVGWLTEECLKRSLRLV